MIIVQRLMAMHLGAIKMKTTTYKTLVNNFIEQLESQGEDFFSTGDAKQDYELIRSRLDQQGFWSGVLHRYYFDEELNITHKMGRF